MRTSLKRIYGIRPKVIQTLEEIRRGRLSYSPREPVVVSKLGDLRGGLFITDGYHRVAEAILRGDRGIEVVLNPSRSFGGVYYRSLLGDDVVNVSAFVKTHRVVPGGRTGTV